MLEIEYNRANVPCAMQKANDAGFAVGNAEIDAIVAQNMQAKAGAYPLAGYATVTKIGESNQLVIDALKEAHGNLATRLLRQMCDGFADISASGIGNVEPFGGKRRVSRHAAL
ncbi:hypothetical protein Rvan_1446 [Rhodomicrobium vannielii ATCC 17100]|uniref:Uncharacterized protein n=1 Tax=Rhodomicrobium vannielii (strain ATCC 17100 / DSM 162 / LMG 4299 / NCIMB 10020 / ATH 3.1.1) TaxID=648757 RepID=E3I6Q4_RHOVT|nr:hypothetical protein Rvan_1446 [Rhodomicrobium vannielii ATCC 17100]